MLSFEEYNSSKEEGEYDINSKWIIQQYCVQQIFSNEEDEVKLRIPIEEERELEVVFLYFLPIFYIKDKGFIWWRKESKKKEQIYIAKNENLTQKSFRYSSSEMSLYFSFSFKRRTSQECVANLILTKRILHSTNTSTEFEKLSRAVGFWSYSSASSRKSEKCFILASTISLTFQKVLKKSSFCLCNRRSSTWRELTLFLCSPFFSFKKSKDLSVLVNLASIASILPLCFMVFVGQEIQYLLIRLAL